MSFYEKGPLRIRYEEAGSGFPLLLIAGGGLNSAIAGLATAPFNPIEAFKGEFRCIAVGSSPCEYRSVLRSARNRSTVGFIH